MDKEKHYSIKQVCKITGISRKSIYLWEAKGKTQKAKRDSVYNYRYYTNSDIRLLKKLARNKITWKRGGR